MLWLLREREFETVHPCQWMLRVVDAPAGIAIDDPQRPANKGPLAPEDRERRGTRRTLVRPTAAVDPRGLSALYAGIPVSTLRRSGLLHDERAEELSSAFAATPFSLDYF
ncbi:hypothetical protein LUW74_09480 [Actinomadura madurae]|uniref:hypothetical protein n=1 Tax=Actinomadura madurae TaxID=1993 RepID=UPI0020261EFE|nr:hypothetical protein [Actinomadura madurae]URN03552.1 hypothetical protein LUW74_09480 [Actinomadura madurae]